jgi:hypothetical protein
MKSLPLSRIRSLMSLPGHALVRLYSYQGRVAWDRAVERGYWTGSDHVQEEGEHGWAPAYDWMRRQMVEHVPDFTGDYPIWAWVKRPSTKPRPRRNRGLSGDFRLTILVPRSRVVFSDYDSWHAVLNRSLNCATEADWEKHCLDFPLHWSMGDDTYKKAYLASIEQSWKRCLEFERNDAPEVVRWSGSTRCFRVQACIDRVHWHEIIDVRWFGSGAAGGRGTYCGDSLLNAVNS